MKTTALVTTLLIGSLAAAAQATTTATDKEVRQQVVSYADLNLESDTGARQLVQRIKVAARRVCGVNDAGVISLAFRWQLHACADDATARALADVNSARSVVAAR